MLPEELTFVQFVLQSMGGIRFIELHLGSAAERGEIRDFALSFYFHYGSRMMYEIVIDSFITSKHWNIAFCAKITLHNTAHLPSPLFSLQTYLYIICELCTSVARLDTELLI